MQQAKAARAAGASASAQSGLAAKSLESTTGSTLTMGGRAESEESPPKTGRSRAKAQSGGTAAKPKKGASAAASTQAPASQKTVGKPGRPAGRPLQASGKSKAAASENAITLLTRDHRTVEELFKSYEAAESADAKEELAQQICMELIIHTQLEEQIFYPACRENGVEDDALDEAQVEHDGAKIMIGELLEGSPDDPYYDAKVKVLKEYIRHHVNEEEKADGIFSKARQASLDLDQLGTEIKAMKEELTAEGDAVAAAPLEAPSLHLNNIHIQSEETHMARQSSYYDDEDDDRSSRGRSGGNRMRDDDGRFMSDDDDDRSSRRRSSRSSRDDDDDDRSYRSSGRGRQDMERDEQGRFMSDDDDDGRSSRNSRSSRGRQNMERDEQGRFMSDDDDDDRGGRSRRGQGHGGWFGDSEGHAEAARQRGSSSRSRSRYDEDDDDDDRSSRGRSSGRGRGWFGDSEGHAQAARQQSQSSSYDDDDDRSSRGRSRSQGGRSQGSRSQSSRSQGGRGQGHGGWFGDSRGHAEAARRGWRDRD